MNVGACLINRFHLHFFVIDSKRCAVVIMFNFIFIKSNVMFILLLL